MRFLTRRNLKILNWIDGSTSVPIKENIVKIEKLDWKYYKYWNIWKWGLNNFFLRWCNFDDNEMFGDFFFPLYTRYEYLSMFFKNNIYLIRNEDYNLISVNNCELND